MAACVRALAWALVSGLILLGGLYALGLGLVTLRFAADAASAGGEVQRAALRSLVETIAREALLPHAALALLAWLGLARLSPRIDASWRALAMSLLACALLAFPIVGAFSFEAWSPTNVQDVVGTALLLSGAVGAALWFARRLLPGLAPGSFGATSR